MSPSCHVMNVMESNMSNQHEALTITTVAQR